MRLASGLPSIDSRSAFMNLPIYLNERLLEHSGVDRFMPLLHGGLQYVAKPSGIDVYLTSYFICFLIFLSVVALFPKRLRHTGIYMLMRR